MSKKTIVIDLDSTLVDLMDEWLAIYNREYDDDLTESEILSWNVSEWVKPECGTKIYDIVTRDGFFKYLKPFPGAVDFVRDLHEAGYNVLIATAPITNPQSFADKFSWYNEHLGFLGPKNFAAIHQKSLLKADLFFDDSPTNISEYRRDWPDSYIISFKYGWNRHVIDQADLVLCDPRKELTWDTLFRIIDDL